MGRQACKLSHDSPLLREAEHDSVTPACISFMCASTNANIVFFLSFLLSFALQRYISYANSHTPSSPDPRAAGTITGGDWGQVVFSTPQIPDSLL